MVRIWQVRYCITCGRERARRVLWRRYVSSIALRDSTSRHTLRAAARPIGRPSAVCRFNTVSMLYFTVCAKIRPCDGKFHFKYNCTEIWLYQAYFINHTILVNIHTCTVYAFGYIIHHILLHIFSTLNVEGICVTILCLLLLYCLSILITLLL